MIHCWHLFRRKSLSKKFGLLMFSSGDLLTILSFLAKPCNWEKNKRITGEHTMKIKAFFLKFISMSASCSGFVKFTDVFFLLFCSRHFILSHDITTIAKTSSKYTPCTTWYCYSYLTIHIAKLSTRYSVDWTEMFIIIDSNPTTTNTNQLPRKYQ